jgi:hypothetical protein
MKKIVLVVFLASLFSCFNKSSNNKPAPDVADTLVGSTLDNINKQCFATVNEYFRAFKKKNSFPYALWINVETIERNDNGHPTGEEAILFNSLEDSLIAKFLPKTPFCFIGRTTRDGYREIIYYVADKVKATEIMNLFIEENKFQRKTTFTIESDPTWEGVSGFYN